MERQPVLTLRDVSKRYGDTVAIDRLNIVVPDNRYVTLLGASGSGKTTLLRLIAGFEEPDSGQILIGTERLDGVAPHRRDVGFVFQNFALFPHLTVAQNIGFGLRYRASGAITNESELSDRVADIIALVGLGGLERRSPAAISGGQRQRVALARTLVTEPRIVLLDEPRGALDANLRERMCDELRAIRERLSVSFLHVTGSETEALVMGDEVAVLSAGRVEQFAPAGILFNRPATAATARHLNAYNIIDGTADGASIVCAAGTIALAEAAALPKGQPAELALRFDRIAVCRDRADIPAGHAGLPARFLTAEFNGASVLSFFQLPGGTMVQVVDHLSAPRLRPLDEGRDYWLGFDPADLIVYSERAA